MGKRRRLSFRNGCIAVILISFFVLHGCAGVKAAEKEAPKPGIRAEEWKFVGSNAQNVKTYYSSESVIRHASDMVTVKIKNLLSEATVSPQDLNEFEYVIQTVEIDCAKKKARPLQTDGYRKDGSSVSDDSLSTWVDIVPQSVGDQLYGIVCQQK
jgi:hypothetical protein